MGQLGAGCLSVPHVWLLAGALGVIGWGVFHSSRLAWAYLCGSRKPRAAREQTLLSAFQVSAWLTFASVSFTESEPVWEGDSITKGICEQIESFLQ